MFYLYISFTFLYLVILYICCMAFSSWPHIFYTFNLLVLWYYTDCYLWYSLLATTSISSVYVLSHLLAFVTFYLWSHFFVSIECKLVCSIHATCWFGKGCLCHLNLGGLGVFSLADPPPVSMDPWTRGPNVCIFWHTESLYEMATDFY